MNQHIQAQYAATFLKPAVTGLLLLTAGMLAAWGPAEDFDQHLERIRHLNNSGQVEEARQLLDQIRSVLAQREPEQQIEYSLLLAHNQGMRGEFERALEALDELLGMELSDLNRMRVLNRAANLAGASRHYPRGFAYLREALLLVDQIDHPIHQSALLGNASQMLAGAGEIERAIAYGTSAVSLADQTDDLRKQCVARQRLVSAWSNAGQSQRLRQITEKAIAACRRAGDPIYLSALANQQGQQLIEDGRLDAAESTLRESIALAEQANYSLTLPVARLLLARILFEQGEHQQASILAAGLLEALSQRQQWEHLASAHAMLAQHHERLGQFNAALTHMEGQIEAHSRQMEQDRSRRLAHLEVAYDLSARDQEIKLLRELAIASELSEQAEQQQTQLRRLAYGTGAIMSALLIVMLIRARRERQHFRRLARRDSLTGLLNHTHFFAEAESALAQSQSTDSDLCLILADIDHFKTVNDQFGHLAGDHVLRRIAARLRERFPEPAIIGRIGGEEFAIVLPDCQPTDASAQIETLRQLINQTRSGEEALRVTISFGLATPQANETLEELRRRADLALYQAKRDGRDRLVMADEDRTQ